jgi:hypothetical protein
MKILLKIIKTCNDCPYCYTDFEDIFFRSFCNDGAGLVNPDKISKRCKLTEYRKLDEI